MNHAKFCGMKKLSRQNSLICTIHGRVLVSRQQTALQKGFWALPDGLEQGRHARFALILAA
ncbi:hypothetical protein ACFS07_11240 [Undibacterium arcticum]